MSDNKQEMFNRNKDIQRMINSFLNDNHMPSVAEMMAKSNKKEEPGILTQVHKIVLQQMIRHHYPDIDIKIKNSHQSSSFRGQVLGVLSSEEIKIIDQLVKDYRLLTDSKIQAKVY